MKPWRLRPLRVDNGTEVMDAFATFYTGWSIVISSAIGICTVIGVFARAKREPGFLGRPYWLCVAVMALLSLATYVLHPLMFSRRSGVWGQELIAYAMLCGALVGGALALLHRRTVRSNNSSEPHGDS